MEVQRRQCSIKRKRGRLSKYLITIEILKVPTSIYHNLVLNFGLNVDRYKDSGVRHLKVRRVSLLHACIPFMSSGQVKSLAFCFRQRNRTAINLKYSSESLRLCEQAVNGHGR